MWGDGIPFVDCVGDCSLGTDGSLAQKHQGDIRSGVGLLSSINGSHRDPHKVDWFGYLSSCALCTEVTLVLPSLLE